MAITLSDGPTTVQLHPDLYWSDENNWFPVEQRVERTLNGAMIVSVAERLSGRPITLEPEDDASAWISRETLDQLRNWAAMPAKTMTLTLRGVSRAVMFRHQDGEVIRAIPVVHYNDVESGDWYRCTIRLMEI